jgi:ribosomal protein S12 methylthiotransferase
VQQVLIDGVDADGAIGRSFADAPEIDGQVYVADGQNLNIGERVDVKITDADEYDLSGLLSGNPY